MSHRPSIAFICPGLVPGADGVGDYTRRFAAALDDAGWQTLLIGTHDPDCEQVLREEQPEQQQRVSVLRIPRSCPERDRGRWLADSLESFAPDWVSLQMVAFGFGHRGMIGPFLATLSPLAPHYRWHLMCHEPWLGINRGASLKFRLWGLAQRHQFRRLLRMLRPAVVHTHAAAYQTVLRSIGQPTHRLPLFSNLPLPPADDTRGPSRNRESLKVLIFGAIPPEFDPLPALQELTDCSLGPAIRLVFAGHNGDHAAALRARLAHHFGHRLELKETGPLPPGPMVAAILGCDLALAVHSWAVWEKSSSLATVLELGLPSVVVRDDWQPCRIPPASAITPPPPHLFKWRPGFDWAAALVTRRAPGNLNCTKVVQTFLHDLQRSTDGGYTS